MKLKQQQRIVPSLPSRLLSAHDTVDYLLPKSSIVIPWKKTENPTVPEQVSECGPGKGFIADSATFLGQANTVIHSEFAVLV